ncbi:MAG: hypothetical protein ABH822_01955, partial [Patescibacteria group bacterium]
MKKPKLMEKTQLKGEYALVILESVAKGAKEILEGDKKSESVKYRRIPPDPRLQPIKRYGGTGVMDMTPTAEELRASQERNRALTQERERKLREKIYQKEKRKRQKKIYELAREGFIEKDNNQNISLTQKGKRKMAELRMTITKQSLFNSEFKKEKEKKVIIFSFDIPEKHRAVRDWIREFLKFLDYQMIQKSVW